MRYIEAPAIYTPNRGEVHCVFLAGGMTGCPDWQQEVVTAMQDAPLVLLNPRRARFPKHDPSDALAQIGWSYEHLNYATAILFWFPCEMLCPITLFELGAASRTHKPLFVGTHPAYQRRVEVMAQLALARPDVTPIHRTLESLIEQLLTYANAEPFGGKASP